MTWSNEGFAVAGFLIGISLIHLFFKNYFIHVTELIFSAVIVFLLSIIFTVINNRRKKNDT